MHLKTTSEHAELRHYERWFMFLTRKQMASLATKVWTTCEKVVVGQCKRYPARCERMKPAWAKTTVFCPVNVNTSYSLYKTILRDWSFVKL
jgi:hypothetical protein